MMERAKYRFIMFFFITVFIFGLLISNVFAIRADFEAIKKLEEMEKTAPPEVIVRPKVEYKAEGLKDPFREPVTDVTPPSVKGPVPGVTEKPLPSLTVQGLIWGGRFPQAIINNKVVKIGDNIEGTVVVGIDKGGITVLFEGRQYKLSPPVAGSAPYKKP